MGIELLKILNSFCVAPHPTMSISHRDFYKRLAPSFFILEYQRV